eukprot:gene67-540_t
MSGFKKSYVPSERPVSWFTDFLVPMELLECYAIFSEDFDVSKGTDIMERIDTDDLQSKHCRLSKEKTCELFGTKPDEGIVTWTHGDPFYKAYYDTQRLKDRLGCPNSNNSSLVYVNGCTYQYEITKGDGEPDYGLLIGVLHCYNFDEEERPKIEKARMEVRKMEEYCWTKSPDESTVFHTLKLP